jgi:glycosyltransferase involved in cell wall biosynthesis
VIRLGIPAAPRRPTEGEWTRFKDRHGLPNCFLLTVGFLHPHKNQKLLVEALALLKTENDGVPLVFVGPDSNELGRSRLTAGHAYADEIVSVARRLGLRQGVDFFGLGHVGDVELEMLYQRASALVMPTLYEAGSFPVREAMRAGCPVVCSDIPPLIEDVELAGGEALLFDPHNPADLARALRSVLADPVSARRQAVRSRMRVHEAFDWQKTASGYLAAFQEAIRSNPQRLRTAG